MLGEEKLGPPRTIALLSGKEMCSLTETRRDQCLMEPHPGDCLDVHILGQLFKLELHYRTQKERVEGSHFTALSLSSMWPH